MHKIIRTLLIGFITVFMFAACAPALVTMAPPDQDAAAKTFVSPPDKARIYVYWQKTMPLGAPVKYLMIIDGKVWGSLTRNTYLILDVSPEEHLVSCGTEIRANVKCEAGKIYFLQLISPIFLESLKLLQVSEEKGQADVKKCKLVLGLLK